jgi:hypothetical protein
MAQRELIRSRCGFEANFVLVNYYRNGGDSIGWHQDDEADLGPHPMILSLSLGAKRDFQFRHCRAADNGLPTVTIPLAHGSLLTMRDPTNKNWKHRVPRRGGTCPERIGPRLNATWRGIVWREACAPGDSAAPKFPNTNEQAPSRSSARRNENRGSHGSQLQNDARTQLYVAQGSAPGRLAVAGGQSLGTTVPAGSALR